MARPKKNGIDYFPFDVDFFSDKKIRILKSRFGADGLTVYIYLLCEIYRNGYYIQLDEDYEYIIADDLGMSNEKVKQVLKFLLERSLLDSTLFQSDTIITSHGIQRRFQSAVKTRGLKSEIEVDGKYWLLSEQETQPFIKCTHNPNNSEKNDSYSGNNPDNSEKNDTKESKVKESKGNKKYCTEPENPPSAPPVFTLPLNDNTEYGISQNDIDHWKELYPAVNIPVQLRKMRGWCEANPTKRKTRRGIGRFINTWLSKEQDRGGHVGDGNGQYSQSRFLEDG